MVFGSTAKVLACQSKWEYVNRLSLEADLQSAQVSGAWKSRNTKQFCQLMAQRQTLGKYILKMVNDAIACQGVAFPEQLAFRDNVIKQNNGTNSNLQKYCR
jgi:hypothetical protein